MDMLVVFNLAVTGYNMSKNDWFRKHFYSGQVLLMACVFVDGMWRFTIILLCVIYPWWLITLSLGFVANGEFNVLRSKGYQRPVSVLQIKAAVRSYYGRLSSKVLKDMLTPTRKRDVQV